MRLAVHGLKRVISLRFHCCWNHTRPIGLESHVNNACDMDNDFTYTAYMPEAPSTQCCLLLSLLMLISNNGLAESESNRIAGDQKYNTGWPLNLDSDILAESDRDYTGGIALTLSVRRAREYLFSLEGIRNWLDDLLGIHRLYLRYPHFQLHSVLYGTMFVHARQHY